MPKVLPFVSLSLIHMGQAQVRPYRDCHLQCNRVVKLSSGFDKVQGPQFEFTVIGIAVYHDERLPR
jgi:hypothetical protein